MFRNLRLLIFVLFAACSMDSKKVDQKSVAEEMKNREIKKVSDSEILSSAHERGAEIAAMAQAALSKKLFEVVSNQGTGKAIEYCNIAAYPILDSLSETHHAEIRRVSLKLRNPKDAPDELERQLLEAYEFNVEKGLELTENIQEIDDQYILFTKPISIGSPMCLKCHGEVRKDISEEDHSIIRSLYPSDSATGYKLGDLRGIWSVKLSKKEIVKSL
ncbi:DUF3365 domain-containing protein [Fulvivirgaceae bacterium BMA10]|uniref:DUF3365 domain-containing protein n=1 Tax=Splendidivirga corallicola TaxID=3051826 RepID=A0ABT8KRF1_9BACT|nr:DUF3365 domain-containing protein [Fulvivirgaceae bacterium BMA10]